MSLAENMPASGTELPEAVSPESDRSLDLLLDRTWTAFASCRQMGQLFFEPFGERPGARSRREEKARAVCHACPVQQVCRDTGRRNHESGIWGGETEEERALAGFAPKSISRRSVAQARLQGQDDQLDQSGNR